jgi:GH18 family chitinase
MKLLALIFSFLVALAHAEDCSASGVCSNKSPDCSAKRTAFERVVGCYEGWATGRRCHAFYPEQIPVGVYTHINFAFATIDPETLEVRPYSDGDVAMYQRLIYRKKMDPGVKIFIAIGGRAFNNPGPMQHVFSKIASTVDNQNKFILSVIRFVATHGFDGVDLDWEYPEAEDRGGNPEDYSNSRSSWRGSKMPWRFSHHGWFEHHHTRLLL